MATKKKAEPAAETEPPAPKKKGSAKAAKKAAAANAAPEPEPTPEAEAAPEPEPEPEIVKFERGADKRSEDEEKAIRGVLKKGHKAIEALEEVLAHFEPGPDRAVKNALKKLTEELEALAPPEPRKCKEYKRAIALARKGEMGIHPDDVMRFCRCSECHALREKAGVPHPLVPKPV